jgi:hypothetical protein
MLKITVACNLGGMWMEAVSQYFTEALKTTMTTQSGQFPNQLFNCGVSNYTFITTQN